MPYIELQNEHVIYVTISRNYTYIESFTCNTTHAMDVGALTPFLGFRGKRKTYEFYERVSVQECMLHLLDQVE